MKLLTRLFTPMALVFLGLLLWQSQATLANLLANIRPSWLALSVLSWLCLYALAPLFTVNVLKGLGGSETYGSLLQIFIARLPAKYLPGGIWQTVARAYDLKARGTTTPQLTQLLIYELGMPVVAAFTVGALLLFGSGSTVPALHNLLLGIAGLGVVSLLLAPLAHHWRFLHLGSIAHSSYWRATAIIILYWILAGCSFASFILALDIEGLLTGFWGLAGAYGFSWGVGYLAIFSPQGLGVLEYTAQQMIDLPLDTAAGVSIVFCFRLLVVCLDLLTWSLLTGSGLLRRILLKH